MVPAPSNQTPRRTFPRSSRKLSNDLGRVGERQQHPIPKVQVHRLRRWHTHAVYCLLAGSHSTRHYRTARHIIDITPTLMDITGADYPPQIGTHKTKPPAGKSLLPIFQGQERQPHEALYWRFGKLKPCVRKISKRSALEMPPGNFTTLLPTQPKWPTWQTPTPRS